MERAYNLTGRRWTVWRIAEDRDWSDDPTEPAAGWWGCT